MANSDKSNYKFFSSIFTHEDLNTAPTFYVDKSDDASLSNRGMCRNIILPVSGLAHMYLQLARVSYTDHEILGAIEMSEKDSTQDFKCSLCDKRFKWKQNLNRHWKTVHKRDLSEAPVVSSDRQQLSRFSCPWHDCSFQYHRINELMKHLKNNHDVDAAAGSYSYNYIRS